PRSANTLPLPASAFSVFDLSLLGLVALTLAFISFVLSPVGAVYDPLLPSVTHSIILFLFMTISLLALDLDGTLLNARGQISDRNRTAIDTARANGVHVAVVTGRRFRDSRPVALELGLDVPVISHNGALTKHAQTLQTVSVLPLPLSAAQEALRVGRTADA